MPDRFAFVQLELAGLVGLDEGRYLARSESGERVLVVRIAGAPAPARRRLRRARPKDADPAGDASKVALTTLTAIAAKPLQSEQEAEEWLAALRDDDEAIAALLDDALVVVNRAVHAARSATLDSSIADVSLERALAVRAGHGLGDELADGRFSAAIELPLTERRARAEPLRSQERVAAVLAGREQVAACEVLLIRARADLDAGRRREAALQVRVGLEALLAERDAFAAPAQEDDLAALGERRRITGEAANEALRGDLPPERAAEVAETLRLCERVLRRRVLQRG